MCVNAHQVEQYTRKMQTAGWEGAPQLPVLAQLSGVLLERLGRATWVLIAPLGPAYTAELLRLLVGLLPGSCLLAPPCKVPSRPRGWRLSSLVVSPSSSLLEIGLKPLAMGLPSSRLGTTSFLFSQPCLTCAPPPPALACPPNSRYTLCAKLCPDTCHSTFSGMACQNRCVEGCECNQGFVLSGLQCVPQSECGCLDLTAGYFKVGRQGWAALSAAARRHLCGF